MNFFFKEITDIIEVRNLTKKVLKGAVETLILNDVSFTIRQKEILGVIGFSGAGKSTLLRCLSGLTNFSSGEVILNKEELSNFKTKAMVFQHFGLFDSKTAWENVAFPLEIGYKSSKKIIREKAHYYLSLVGMSHKAKCYPVTLSGGEKQRVAIARALACESKLVFCDEATSALDAITTKEIVNLLLNLNENLGLSFLFVTHDIDIMKKLCHRALIMEEGKILEQGTVEELLKCPKARITKKLLGIEEQKILASYYKDKENIEILRLSFDKSLVLSPIISSLSQKSKVSFSILSGDIDFLQKKTVGFLTIAIEGSKLDRDEAKKFLRQENVIVYEYSGKY